MIRHPLLRAAQAMAAAAAGALVAARPAPQPRPTVTRFTLAVLGERERSDGAWDGADLLRDPETPVDRFQLTLTPEADARALVEAQAPDGTWERLYLGTLAGHRDYALPAPHTFFGVQGDARVRLTLSRARAPLAEASRATAGEIEDGPPLALSDGVPFRTARVRFSSERAATVELHVRGR